MHVNFGKDPVDIRVQGQCTINCIIFRVVQMVHAISRRPMMDCTVVVRDFPIKYGLIPKGET